MEEKQEGVVLRSIDFKDRQKIITLFTPQKGVISLIIKGISRKKYDLVVLASPFTQGEYHFKVGRTDLYLFRDGSVMNHNYPLRERLETVEAATGMFQALLSSQFKGKPAPALYTLTLSYIKYLPAFDHPETIYASFLLKLLKHEGLLSFTKKCSVCDKDITHFFHGECFCSDHLPSAGMYLKPDEVEYLSVLANARSMEELKVAPAPCLPKIKEIFNSQIGI